MFSAVPFSSWKEIKNLIPLDSSFLDVGCADGDMMRITGHNFNHFSVGIDLFMPYLRRAQMAKTHSEFILADANFLPFRARSFEVVLCLEVLEHFDSKNAGRILIRELESIASKRVILSTPIGLTWQRGYGGNESQEHKVGWTVDDMLSLGFHVSLIGIREIPITRLVKRLVLRMADRYAKGNVDSIQGIKLVDLFARVPYYLIGGLVRFSYTNAGHMICVKNVA